MKANFFALAAVGWMMIGAGLQAQEASKMGSDPDACTRNYSLYREFYKQENYADAIPWWQKTIAICPKYSKNLWIHGETMYKTKLEKESDPKKQAVLFDSLMWVYDQRILNFGDDPRTPEGYVLGQKGISILKYKKEDYLNAYEVLKKSIGLMGSQSSAPVILTYMQSSRQLFIDGTIDAGQVLTDYETTMEIAEANLKLTPDDDGFITAKEGIESYFSNSGAASCEALTKLYGPKLGALKDDPEWLKKVTKQLKKAGCTDIQLFSDASEALFSVEPSAEAAHNIAALFMRREQFDRASEYLQKAIDIGANSAELPDMYYELAFLNFQHYKNYQRARALALNAIEARPNWGKPYILIGQCYIGARNQVFNDEWDRKTVFWVAVDKFIKAKTVDPEVTDEANNLINTYSEYFPNNEEVFFHTLKEGDSYTVGGWIGETTKIRSKRL